MQFKWHPDEPPPELESHSKAKLTVLRSYLRAYFRRLNVDPQRDTFRLDLIDGFAETRIQDLLEDRRGHGGKALVRSEVGCSTGNGTAKARPPRGLGAGSCQSPALLDRFFP